MIRLLCAFLVLPLFLHSIPLAAQEVIGQRDERTARVDAIFAEWDRPDTPGCALGVYRDGEILYARGYGMADLERWVPITPRTVFDIGSTSKQFAAASVVLLQQQGKLSLDDDVRRWVPELPAYQRPVTLRHLLHHTSGLRDYIGLLTLGGARIDDVTTEEDAIAAIARQRELNFAPGDEYLYSNSGYFLLSLIVQRASGQSLRDFAREQIFAPLGMTRTHYLGSYDDIVPDRALAYSPRPGGGLRTDVSRWLQLGDGAVFTTVEELLLWDRNFYDPRVGGPGLLAELQAPGRLNDGKALTYALGLMVEEHRGVQTVSHGGSWGGYRAELLRFPEQRFSVATLCNLGTADPSRLARQVADVYLADVLRPVAAPPRAAFNGRAARVSPRTLQARVGTYRSPQTRALRTVTFEDGKLFLTTVRRFELRPRSANEFELLDAPVAVRVLFEPAAAGQPRRLQWLVEGQEPQLFEEIELATPGAAELEAYTGSFFSEELQATYTLAVVEGVLRLQRRGAPAQPLHPTIRDEFTAAGSAGGVTVRFTRGPGGEVTGFLLDLGRVRNLHFERRQVASR